MWHYTDQTEQMLLNFYASLDEADISPAVKNFLKAWIKSLSHGTRAQKSLVAYLVYMTERLVLMKKVLKDTGSIYYHCDPTASHYIKIIMDGIFGRDNFSNEIIWAYKTGGIPRNIGFAKKHDVILFYKMTNKTFFKEQQERSYVPTLPEPHTNSGKNLKVMRDKVCDLCQVGSPSQKYRMVRMRDVWEDISTLFRNDRERLGYQTQKPLALLGRIIKASCPKNGTVLDPFCGCGTACVSAELNNRKWIGIDVSIYAIEEVEARLEKLGLDEGDRYELIKDSPQAWDEYTRLDPYQKQDYLIKSIGGYPNPVKSGDGGIDGELTIRLGVKKGKEEWGKVVFSVKTGNQASPVHIRELKGLLRDGYDMGVLILERDPTGEMDRLAADAGQLKYYKGGKDLPAESYDRIQILTAGDIVINKTKFNRPDSLQEVKQAREYSQKNLL